MVFFFFVDSRRKKEKEAQEKPVNVNITASQNPAFDGNENMYAEIGNSNAPSTPKKSLNLNQLPFTPDPSLRLGLDARYSMDAGLYSEPTELEKISGHGAIDGPSIMRISNSSLNRSIEAPPSGSRILMTPMTPDEIDALYAKPDKSQKKNRNGNQPPPSSSVSSSRGDLDRQNSSNQSLPSFKDPSGSQLQIPPPLATGSRSNSQHNIYNTAPLVVPPRRDVSFGEINITGSTHSIETDV